MNTKDNLLGNTQHFLRLTARAEKTLKSVAFLVVSVAIMSQSAMAYYAAAYYSESKHHQNFSLENLKLRNLDLHDKKIMGIGVSDLNELITFKCEK